MRGHCDEFLHGYGAAGEGETEVDVFGGAQVVANHLDFGHVEVNVEVVVGIDLKLDGLAERHAEYFDETRAHAMAVCFSHVLAHDDDDDDGSFHALRFHGSLSVRGQNSLSCAFIGVWGRDFLFRAKCIKGVRKWVLQEVLPCGGVLEHGGRHTVDVVAKCSDRGAAAGAWSCRLHQKCVFF